MAHTLLRYLFVAVLSTSSATPLLAQSWQARQSLPSSRAIEHGVCFEAGGKLYVGGGVQTSTIYEYTPGSDTWTARTSVPGTIISYREGAVSFTLGGKGYVGLGVDFNPANFSEIYLQDLWQYDESNNTWTRKADLPSSGRDAATAFVVNGKAYIAGGKVGAGLLAQVWEYDPAADQWNQKTDMPVATHSASAFAALGKGYVLFGMQHDTTVKPSTQAVTNKLYQYDPVGNTWTTKASYPGVGRMEAIAVLADDTTVLAGSGRANVTAYKDLNRYHFATNTWTVDSSYPDARFEMAAARLGSRVYAGSGKTFLNFNLMYHNEWKELKSSSLGSGQTGSAMAARLSAVPNPSGGHIVLRGYPQLGNCRYWVYSVTGALQQRGSTSTGAEIDLSAVAPALYTIRVQAGDGSILYTQLLRR